MYKHVENVKYPYCQKVLPLTYDNSLSYYEAISKIVATVNDIVAIINVFDPPDLQPIYDRLDAIEAVNESQQSAIDELRSEVNVITENVDNLLTNVATLTDQVATLESVAENHERRISALESIVRYYMQPVNLTDDDNIVGIPYQINEVTISDE